MSDYDPSELQNPFTSSARPGDFERASEGENYGEVQASLKHILDAISKASTLESTS